MIVYLTHLPCCYAFSVTGVFPLKGQSCRQTQSPHNGLRALQISRPCQINQWWAAAHFSLGISFCKSSSVASGVFAAERPKRWEVRKT